MRRREELRVRSYGERIGRPRSDFKFERTNSQWTTDEMRGREESEGANNAYNKDIRRQPHR